MKFVCVVLLLACAVIAIEAKAVKSCTCTVPLVLRPVCGNDGKTYDSQYAIDCHNVCKDANVKAKHHGACKDHKSRKGSKSKEKSKE